MKDLIQGTMLKTNLKLFEKEVIKHISGEKMKIAIVGIGGVGGYYGGLLAKRYSGDEDVEIIFIARGDHLKQIKINGFRKRKPDGTGDIHRLHCS